MNIVCDVDEWQCAKYMVGRYLCKALLYGKQPQWAFNWLTWDEVRTSEVPFYTQVSVTLSKADFQTFLLSTKVYSLVLCGGSGPWGHQDRLHHWNGSSSPPRETSPDRPARRVLRQPPARQMVPVRRTPPVE